MSTLGEIYETVELLKNMGTRYIMLQCNSTYPTPYKDINLRFMKKLEKISFGISGYSGHERGIEIPIAAVAMGAKVIEKHITLDKTLEGNDHKISLLPEEFEQMVLSIRNVESSMGSGEDRTISQGEIINRAGLAKSIIARVPIKKGEVVESSMLNIASPGKGLQPNYKKKIVGRKSKRDMKAGDFFYLSDLAGHSVSPRQYVFPFLWGIPVRYHDYQYFIDHVPLKFVEFHLSYWEFRTQH